ncbi:TPA: hypothetical protein QB657_001488 [Pasteurella multocida]|nr:hypothetical protein [Pasteurella multocida]
MTKTNLNNVSFDWVEFDELVIELGHVRDLVTVVSIGVADTCQTQAGAIASIDCLLSNLITGMKEKQEKTKKGKMTHTPYELTAFNAKGGIELVSYYQTYEQANEEMRSLQRSKKGNIVEVRINRIDGKSFGGQE